jgi:hypothetical protein
VFVHALHSQLYSTHGYRQRQCDGFAFGRLGSFFKGKVSATQLSPYLQSNFLVESHLANVGPFIVGGVLFCAKHVDERC